ncbi:MAG: dolichyl-phosphooligosaccharide-protein glycotransferase [Thermococcaceae archaeon]|nr:dolichyl-phosphooligosaccharide-protein glycotransferase [Thermococcaceae archaeon]
MNTKDVLKPKFALPLVTGVALILRLLPLRLKYMLGYDPYFHLAYIEEALKAGEWFNFLTIAGGPWGFQVRTFHPLGLWMTPAYVYKVLKVFGISLYDAFRITPVIFGVLTVAFFYLALLKLYDEKRALFASLFLAVSFGHVFRSMANYYRGDNYMLFWYSIALFGTAYALRGEKFGSKRFLLYLIPALASGFASIFWQAYYPIFVFLLANALFLAAGAFVLEEKERLLDSLALALSTLIGALIANSLGGKFGYGMLGYNQLGKKVAERLSLQFGTFKDAYLLVHVKYLLPLTLAFIAILFVLWRFIKGRKARIGLLAGLAILGVLLLFYRFEALKDLSTGFGIFKDAPIAETRPPTTEDLWKAFSISLFLSPLFLLRFHPKKAQSSDFLLLGLIAPSLYMIATWTRFLFIGSMGMALMAGVGLVELQELLKPHLEVRKLSSLGLALLVLFPLINAGHSAWESYTITPFMDEDWEKALRWLGENSNENDVVMIWWDYGHWVTYYARRGPVAQGGPSPGVALYYLGKLKENWAANLGVDYVVVSYDYFLKLDSIISTARLSKGWENLSGEEYGFLPLTLTRAYGDTYVFENGAYRATLSRESGSWEAKLSAGGPVYPSKIIVEAENGTTTIDTGIPNAPVLYVNLNSGYALLMSPTLANTTFARLFTGDVGMPYRLVYSDGRIKIYRLEHPNVIVERKDGITLRFENATGTGLGVYGLLDNGTIVFKKWYGVKGLEEFKLPENINGTVVVRYTYVKGKKVLDRGIFRLDLQLGEDKS